MHLVAIGDIHGCFQSLKALITKLDLDEDTHVVFVGDYIDRGPDSRSVIEYLLDFSHLYRCTFLRGNHEAMMLEFLETGDLELWRLNGGLTTLDSYMQDGRAAIPERHVEFLKRTSMYLDEEEFFFVHAGLNPRLSIEENLRVSTEETFLWGREHLHSKQLAWEKPVVCGHTPQPRPLLRENLICIDTGCVFRGEKNFGTLTAIRLPERELIIVPNQEGGQGYFY